MESKEITAVKSYIAAINNADLTQLSNLMSEDHTFVDSGGQTVTGRDRMTTGWRGYFDMFPDYKIQIENIFQHGNIVAIFGSAFGTYNGKRGLVPENRIEMTAAWKTIVENGKIKYWQVYADWTEGQKIIKEDEKTNNCNINN